MPALNETKFEFERSRGIVWVCDIANSTKLLNNNATAKELEDFIPRLHWLARCAVSHSGGEFIKWTGDGFLAWYPIELYRELGDRVSVVLDVIWHLSVIVNKTKLGVDPNTRLRLRHGITIEHDALVTKIINKEGTSVDLIGRAVILAFRLSTIPTQLPNIVAQKKVIESTEKENLVNLHFKKLNINTEDKLKYFKGENWGTNNLVASHSPMPRKRKLSSMLASTKRVVEEVKKGSKDKSLLEKPAFKMIKEMEEGPTWAREAAQEYIRFLRDDLLGALESALYLMDTIKKLEKEQSKTEN